MSKQRAVRRAVREQEAAQAAVVRRAEAARRERRDSRRAGVIKWLPTRGRSPSGILARRRQARTRLVVAALVLVQVLVWIARDDWPARLAALVVALLLLPLLLVLSA